VPKNGASYKDKERRNKSAPVEGKEQLLLRSTFIRSDSKITNHRAKDTTSSNTERHKTLTISPSARATAAMMEPTNY
jgi:hypothetical protein